MERNKYTKKQNLTDACINISLRLETNCFCWRNISLQKKINTRCRKVILSNHNHENADCSAGVGHSKIQRGGIKDSGADENSAE